MKKIVENIISKIEKFIKKYDEKKIYKYILLFFFVLAIIQLLIPGLPKGHDLFFHLSRIEGITDGIKSGSFPVLIYPGYLSDYGYANGVFYPDIFLYIPAFLHLCGLSTILSYKIFMILITFGIFYSMYFSVKKITKSDFTATVSSIIYLMSSYRITDMWVRAAVGETLTFVFLPLVILGLYKLLYDNEKEWYYFTIGLVGVVLSHLLSGIFCILIVLFFGLFSIKKVFKEKARLKYALISGCLAIGITMFFTAPLLEVMTSDSFVYQTYSDGTMTVERSVNPLMTILEIPYQQDPWIPMGVGIIFLILAFYLRKVKVEDKDINHFKNLSLVLGWFFLFMSTSLFPWNIFGKVFGMLQFPWRLYSLVTLLLVFGFAILINETAKKMSKKIVVMILISAFSIGTFGIMTYYSFRAGFLNNQVIKHRIVWGEYVPSDVDKEAYKERGNVITSNNPVEVAFNKLGTNIEITYSNNTADNTYLELPLMYYKGYVAKDGDVTLDVSKGENGVLRVALEEESGTIEVYYGFTVIRKIGITISILSLIVFIYLSHKKKKNA